MSDRLKPETLAAQALGWLEEPFKGLAPPIHPATTYEREPDGSYPTGKDYSRDSNPSYEQVEAVLAALENGAASLVFGSGMAAAIAVFQALRPGDHVVAPEVMYWGLRKWLNEFAVPWGLSVDYVPAGDMRALSKALEPGRTKLVWAETPANPTWDVTDIAAVAEAAHAAGAYLAVDSTVATPAVTRPLELGADIVMHSATKYLNGHSDVVAGALVTANTDDFWTSICMNRAKGGAVLGPFESWLLLRGMRTLYIRVRTACASAQAIAEHFDGHPRIEAVLYPGLKSHPGHEIAMRQMQGGFGGMLSIRFTGGEASAMKVAANLKVFKRATSLGGVESLVEHRASIEGPDSPVPPDLLRFSVGIEDTGDLIDDIEQAIRNL